MSRERKVFVSSTTKDLHDCRERTIAVIHQADCKPVCMEDFGAEGRSPLEVCRAAVGACDIYLGIFACRYGYVPPGYTKSITELEYQEAAARPMDRWVFLLKEGAPWPVTFAEDELKRAREFREHLEKDNICRYFTTPDDLAAEVDAALARRPNEPPPPEKGRFQVGLPFDPLRYFLDRKPQLGAARDYFQNPNRKAVFVCVVGRGGYGKTALVSKICLDMQDGKEIDGIVYRPCRGAEKPSLERIFRDFGELLGGESQRELLEVCNEASRSVADKTRFLLEMIRERRYAYAFDNLEALMDGDGLIIDPELREFVNVLLTMPHNVRLVASSRVTPLIMPPANLAAEIISLDEGLPQEDAVCLVRELNRPGFMKVRITDPAIHAQIAARCQGLPRALQLFMGVLQKPKDPAPGSSPTPSCESLLRNDTLFGRYIIENLLHEHYESLQEDDRRTVEALAVLGGPIATDAIAGVVRRIAPSVNVQHSLDRLWRCGTVTCPSEDTMVLQALDQQYIIPQMQARADDDPFCLKSWHHHAAEYYKEVPKPPEPWENEKDVEPVLREIDHRTQAEEFTEAARLIHKIDDKYLFRWGHFRTIVNLRERLVNKLMEPQEVHQNLGHLGNVYRLLGRRPEAISSLKEAIRIAECEGNKEGQGEWWTYLGDTYADAANFAEADKAYEAAITIARASGDKRSEAASLGSRAILCRQTGRIPKAIKYYQQAIVLDKELDDKDSLGKHIGNKACAYVALDDCPEAIRLFEEAKRLAVARNNTQSLAYLPMDMARAYLQREDFETARRLNRESLDICEKKTQEKRCMAYAAFGLGQAIHHQGNLQDAQGYYEQALGLEVPEVSHKAAANLGIIALAQGHSQKAAGLFEKAVGHCEKLIKDFPLFYEAVYHRAAAELGLGADAAALKTLKSALDICSAKGVLKEASQCLELLKRAKPDLKGLRKAFQMLKAAGNQPKVENR